LKIKNPQLTANAVALGSEVTVNDTSVTIAPLYGGLISLLALVPTGRVNWFVYMNIEMYKLLK